MPGNSQIFFTMYILFTFIYVISYSYKLHIPQGVHVASTWSTLAFWYEEQPKQKHVVLWYWNLHLQIKACIFLCKILHFLLEAILLKKAVTYISQKGLSILFQTIMHVPIEASILKKACTSQKIQKECCNTSRGIVFVIK